ncbi:MAG: T9SS type A sorting domain-containing protein [Bacteroidales bacterium]|nr:T9SS type A sorting domain-containing protein [Bacteroidales bacterium]
MKKIIAIVILVCSAVAAHAQDNLDTVFGRYPYYFYNYYDNCWDHDTTHENGLLCYIGCGKIWQEPMLLLDSIVPHWEQGCFGRIRYFYNEVAIGYVPDDTLRVVGFAFVRRLYNHNRYGVCGWMLDSTISNAAECHFNLYDRNMQPMQTKTVVNRDLHPARVLPLGRDQLYILRSDLPLNYLPSYEVFFDSSVEISDTFYLSKTMTYGDSTLLPDVVFVREGHVNPDPNAPHWVDSSCVHRLPEELRRYRNDILNGVWEDWLPQDSWTMFLIYPIIERPGDTCPEVRGLRWSRLGSGTTAFVQWDAGVNHRDWQLSYGPSGTPAGEGTVVDCPPAQCVLPGLAAGVTYDIYVRARCRFARGDEWTGWSGPLEVGFGNPGEGIDEAAGLHAELTPNPATGRVKVVCAEAMRKVEVYDMQGRRCLAQEAQGTETELDISALAAGRYTVLLHTATTTAAKAMVVQ